MEHFENLQVETSKSGICTITINRPDKLNSLSTASLHELEEAIQYVYDEKAVKGAIIIGSGDKAFVAGADIQELVDLGELNGRKFAEKGQEVFEMIENSEKPIIAAINGYALGGGCELALACHIRIATSNALMGLPEVSLGIVPGYGGTQRLPQIVGKGRAIEMMVTGERITAFKAEQIGLVNQVVNNKEELVKKCETTMLKIFENAPLAVGMVISCVNCVYHHDENGYQTEANSFSNCCKTEDFKEGTLAFLEKRKPEFTGN